MPISRIPFMSIPPHCSSTSPPVMTERSSAPMASIRPSTMSGRASVRRNSTVPRNSPVVIQGTVARPAPRTRAPAVAATGHAARDVASAVTRPPLS
jgi:hypothetical protein